MKYLLEVSFCLAIFYGGYHFLFRQETFFQRNRFYLLLTAGLSLFIPLIQFDFFGESSSILLQPLKTVSNQSNQVIGVLESSTQFSWFHFFLCIYGAGVFVFALRLGWNLLQIHRLIQNSKIEIHRDYFLIPTDGKLPTFSFFKYLFWDNTVQLNSEEKDKILLHELTHIQQRHTYDVLFLEALKIVFWFNPFIYFYSQSLKNIHEFIADQQALGTSKLSTYNRLIVQSLFKQLDFRLTHHFNKSQIQQRLKMLEKGRTREPNLLKVLIIIPLMFVTLLLFAQPTVSDTETNRFATAEIGLDAFYKELQKNLDFPKEWLEEGTEGKLYLQFTVTAKGDVKNIEIDKSFDERFNQFTIEAFQKTDVIWLPAKVDGKVVSQRLTLPIVFKNK